MPGESLHTRCASKPAVKLPAHVAKVLVKKTGTAHVSGWVPQSTLLKPFLAGTGLPSLGSMEPDEEHCRLDPDFYLG